MVFGPATNDTLMSAADVTLDGATYAGLFGRSLDAVDLDLDGVDDMVVGAARGGSSLEGAVYVFYGPVTANTDSSTADVELLGEDPYDEAGTAIAVGGDYNNDGYPDLLMGAHYDDDGGSNAGAAYIIDGGGL